MEVFWESISDVILAINIAAYSLEMGRWNGRDSHESEDSTLTKMAPAIELVFAIRKFMEQRPAHPTASLSRVLNPMRQQIQVPSPFLRIRALHHMMKLIRSINDSHPNSAFQRIMHTLGTFDSLRDPEIDRDSFPTYEMLKVRVANSTTSLSIIGDMMLKWSNFTTISILFMEARHKYMTLNEMITEFKQWATTCKKAYFCMQKNWKNQVRPSLASCSRMAASLQQNVGFRH